MKKYQITNTKRNKRIMELRAKKMSFRDIGKLSKITGERARQIYHREKAKLGAGDKNA